MSQQSYFVDLPFRFNHTATVHDNYPVVWMQDTEGKNTLTVGLIDQQPYTVIEGSTYDTANGGEAPGIANSYVGCFSAAATIVGQRCKAVQRCLMPCKPRQEWHDALKRIVKLSTRSVVVPGKISEWAMNPCGIRGMHMQTT